MPAFRSKPPKRCDPSRVGPKRPLFRWCRSCFAQPPANRSQAYGLKKQRWTLRIRQRRAGNVDDTTDAKRGFARSCFVRRCGHSVTRVLKKESCWNGGLRSSECDEAKHPSGQDKCANRSEQNLTALGCGSLPILVKENGDGQRCDKKQENQSEVHGIWCGVGLLGE